MSWLTFTAQSVPPTSRIPAYTLGSELVGMSDRDPVFDCGSAKIVAWTSVAGPRRNVSLPE